MSLEPDVDDEEEEEEEEEETPSWHSPSTGPDREDMAAEYLPDQDDWEAKTILSINDPARVAVLRNWGEIFPECQHHQPVIDDFVDHFLRGRTSVAGESRDDYKGILQSMFGGKPEDSKRSALVDILAGDLDREE